MAEQKTSQQPEQDLSQQTRVRREKLAALQAEGVETELVWIGNKEIRGCIACGICGKTGELIRQYVPEANL